MIRNFRHKGLKQLYEKADRKGLSTEMVPKIERIVARLDVATGPEMMNLPGLKLHPLKGKLKGFWGVYFTQCGAQLIVLLAGGSKRTQKRDVKRAKALAALLD